MSRRHPDAPPALPTDVPAPDPEEEPWDPPPPASMAGPSIEAARKAAERGDMLTATAESLTAIGRILTDLEAGGRLAADGRSLSYFLLSLTWYFRAAAAMQGSATFSRRALLEEMPAVRFRYGRGPLRTCYGEQSSATAAVFHAYDTIEMVLSWHPEAPELCRALGDAASRLPWPEGARERGADLLQLLEDMGGDGPALAEGVRRFPAEELLGTLLGAFDDLGIDRLVAEMHQEIAQVLRDARLEGWTGDRDGQPPECEARPDGPEPPCWLWWGGQRHLIGNGRAAGGWRLLNYMWGLQAAPYGDLQGPGRPWPDPVSPGAVATAVTRLNACLPAGFPRRLVTRSYCVFWEELQTISAG